MSLRFAGRRCLDNAGHFFWRVFLVGGDPRGTLTDRLWAFVAPWSLSVHAVACPRRAIETLTLVNGWFRLAVDAVPFLKSQVIPRLVGLRYAYALGAGVAESASPHHVEWVIRSCHPWFQTKGWAVVSIGHAQRSFYRGLLRLSQLHASGVSCPPSITAVQVASRCHRVAGPRLRYSQRSRPKENETIIRLKGVCPGHKLAPGLLLAGKEKLKSEVEVFQHVENIDAVNEMRPVREGSGDDAFVPVQSVPRDFAEAADEPDDEDADAKRS